MVVYRYLSKRELDAFIEGDMDSVGAEYYESKKSIGNTHDYKEGVKYLHFFQSLKDLKHIAKVRDNSKEHFVAQFDIPLLTLLSHTGKGYYPASGFDVDYEVVREYAIPVDNIRPSFLDGYVSANEFKIENTKASSRELTREFDLSKELVNPSLIDVVQEQN